MSLITNWYIQKNRNRIFHGLSLRFLAAATNKSPTAPAKADRFELVLAVSVKIVARVTSALSSFCAVAIAEIMVPSVEISSLNFLVSLIETELTFSLPG